MPSLLAIISSKDSRIRVVHKSFPGCVDEAVLVWTAGLVGGTGCGPGVEPNGLLKLALSAVAAGLSLFALGAPPFLAGAFGAGEMVLTNVALSRPVNPWAAVRMSPVGSIALAFVIGERIFSCARVNHLRKFGQIKLNNFLSSPRDFKTLRNQVWIFELSDPSGSSEPR